MTNPTRSVPARTVFALAHKVQTSWATHPAFFTGHKVAKDAYDAAIARAAEADSLYSQSRATQAAEVAAARLAKDAAIAAAKDAYSAATRAAAIRTEEALKERNVALLELSRLANGARYYAKSVALSDETNENDAAGREL